MTSISRAACLATLAAAQTPFLLACEPGDDETTATGRTVQPHVQAEALPACDPDDGGLILPAGFCALVVADGLGLARHIAVTPQGDVFVAINDAYDGSSQGEIVALRDLDDDGRADVEARFGGPGGTGILWDDGHLYFAQNGRIVVYHIGDGELVPTEPPEVLVDELPGDGDHPYKSLAMRGRRLFVNIASASNACQVENRVRHSPGLDPCPELPVRAGVWMFDTHKSGQLQSDGRRFATGLRNVTALAIGPDGRLYGAQNGRDQLHENWPERFTVEQDRVLPAEVFVRIRRWRDHGWPYCYYDAEQGRNVLAPEYGGDGELVGRCEGVELPRVAFPAHWAPLGLTFYEGRQFPARYRGGAFLAFHGSRFEPLLQPDGPGYNVMFVPDAAGDRPGEPELFADGFTAGAEPLPDAAPHRPVGVTEGPDGSLYISDDKGGRLWRVLYVGE